MNEPELIGVVGLGFLGRGIAACLLGHGFHVLAFTTGEDTHEKARSYIGGALDEMVSHGVTGTILGDTWRERYRETDDLHTFARCTFVIESVTEDAAVKAAVFDALEAAVDGTVPIASNTSALPITMLQSTRRCPERFLGMHWAEPAYATRFMEIIRGEKTGPRALEQALELGRRTGKDPAIVNRDVPGFIVNRLGYAMYREAIHLVESGVADVETIDRAFSNACGLWATFCGPFRWIDITGGPALYAKAMEAVLPTLAVNPEMSETMRRRLEGDERGVRNQRGFYEYGPADQQRWEAALHEHAWTVWKIQERYRNEHPEI